MSGTRSATDGSGSAPDKAARANPPRTLLRSRWRAARTTVSLYLAVAVGSMIGGVSRALASMLMQHVAGPEFPWGTLLVNVLGSLVIGFYATLTEPDGRAFAAARQRQFVMAGICGGFTTFSVFSLETLQLMQAGNMALAGVNVGASVIAWLVAVWLGHSLASRVNRIGGN